jgi:uncharacterized protein YndB with AHSA1/START domain
MKTTLKWLVGGLIVILALLFLGGSLLSPKFTVARSVTMQASAEKIYPLIANPRTWKQWSIWNRRDPNMQITYEGPESGDGAKWIWKSASQGDGAMTFMQAAPPNKLGYELYFPDFGTTSTGSFALEPQGAQTKVTWTMNGDMGTNPLYRWIALFADSMVGKDFDEGLQNLKQLAEKP